MASPRIAKTELDVAASKAGHALEHWLDNIPTILQPVRTEAEQARADRAADIIDEQVEVIRREKKAGP